MTLLASRARARTRAGFTLIELLVVVTIIVILVSLLLAGVFYAFSRMKMAQASSDISQFSASLQAFKSKYGFYPPDQFHLCSNRTDYNSANPLDARSLAVIDRMWPNIGNFVGIDWSGTGVNNINEILDGDQSMVFFLGGIPGNATVGMFNGFSVNSKDPNPFAVKPSYDNRNAGRIGPFYAFSTDRVYLRQGNYFPSFKDSFAQQPYLYFSANNMKNGYNPYFPTNFTYTITVPNYPNSATTTTVQAYYSTAPAAPASRGQYLNPDSFQIICAGANGNFGTGGAWSPATAESVYPASNPGQDDLSNFYDATLGVSR